MPSAFGDELVLIMMTIMMWIRRGRRLCLRHSSWNSSFEFTLHISTS